MKILVAVDGSEHSLHAVDALVRHAAEFHDKPAVHLLHVHLPIPIGMATHHVSRENLDRYYREEGEAALADALQRCSAAGLSCTTHIHVGQPAETIVRLAQELGCALICMGTHGRGVLPSAILGSVANKVVHLSELPVLLTK